MKACPAPCASCRTVVFYLEDVQFLLKNLFCSFFFNFHCNLIDVKCCMRSSLVAQKIKHLPTMRETRVRSLGREDTLVKAMATHSSIHAWKIPLTEEPGRLQSMGSQNKFKVYSTMI